MPKAKGRPSSYVENANPFTTPDYEIAELRLALLKENFRFQEFYKEVQDNPRSACTEFRDFDKESIEEYEVRFHLLLVKGVSLFGGYAKDFGVNELFIRIAQIKGISTDDILKMLNPFDDFQKASLPYLAAILPLLFASQGVVEFTSAKGLIDYPSAKPMYRRYPLELSTKELRPYERILKIDLRRPKKQLLGEFGTFVDIELGIQQAGINLEAEIRKEKPEFTLHSSHEWTPHNKRERNEAWDQLKVWRLRKQQESFAKIAAQLGISEDLAKKRFQRAFELILGQKYDKEIWKKYFHEERGKQELAVGKIEYGINNTLFSDPEVSALLNDIEKMCQTCPDKVCNENRIKTFYENGLSSWDACPRVYQYLKG